MSDSYCWSASAGRWLGIPVRIHVLLFLFIAVIFGMDSFTQGSNVMFSALVTSIILVASLVLHELAHVFAISNLGGNVNNIVLAPWGGLSDFALPATRRAKAIVHLAGPFLNGIIVLFGLMLLVQTGKATSWELINPFSPHGFRPGEWEISLIRIATWVNFQLCIVNLIPCFPFDGAHVLRIVVESLNPELSRVRSETSIMVFGHAIAFTLIGMAWFLRNYQDGPIQPVWLLMLSAGIVMVFSARYSFIRQIADEADGWGDLDELDYDSLYDDSAFFDLPEDESSGYSQWLSEKQEARRREEIRIHREEAARADEILKKLHSEGIDSLSEEEKALLHRVSERIRRQRDQKNVELQNDDLF